MQKRLISMVLALSMALTAMPLPALAQSAPPDTASAAALAEENGSGTGKSVPLQTILLSYFLLPLFFTPFIPGIVSCIRVIACTNSSTTASSRSGRRDAHSP